MEIAEFLGLVNTIAPERMRPGQLTVARDVDIDDAGAIRSRQGFSEVTSTSTHSLWARGRTCLVVQAGTLRRMTEAGTFVTLATLTSSAPMSYVEHNGVVYYSNGVDVGRVSQEGAGSWGVEVAPPAVAAPAAGGFVPAGNYLVATAFVRDDGLEGGTSTPTLVTLTEDGSISFPTLPVPAASDVVGIALYVSGPNGSTLYRHAVVPVSQSSHLVHSHQPWGIALDPSPREPAPAGTIVESHGGRTYVVDGSTVWYSGQFQPEVFHRATQFMQFPDPVTMWVSVDTGIYASTDRQTWFLEGTDVTSIRSAEAMDYGAIPGTACKMSMEDTTGIEDGQIPPTQPGAVWTSRNGVIMGLASGQVKNLTETHFGIPATQRGAGLVRSARGYTTYVASLQGNSSAANTY